MKQKPKFQYPLYVITWRDAVFHDDDSKSDEEFEPELVISVGWLIKETENHVVICQDHGDELWVRRRLTIPAGMIVEKRKIL